MFHNWSTNKQGFAEVKETAYFQKYRTRTLHLRQVQVFHELARKFVEFVSKPLTLGTLQILNGQDCRIPQDWISEYHYP